MSSLCVLCRNDGHSTHTAFVFHFWLIEMMILWVQKRKKNKSLSERSAKCTKSRVTQGGYRKDRAMSSKDWSREKAESHEEHHWEKSKSVSTLFEISCCIWDSGFSGLHWSQNEIMSARITLSVNAGHGKNEGGMAGKNSFYRNNPHEGLSLQQ